MRPIERLTTWFLKGLASSARMTVGERRAVHLRVLVRALDESRRAEAAKRKEAA